MLIPLIIIGSVGSAYYRLAHDHHRKAWPYALLGVGVLIGSYAVFLLVLALILVLTGNIDVLETSFTILLEIILYALAGTASLLLYLMLKKNWSKNPKNQKEDDITIDNF